MIIPILTGVIIGTLLYNVNKLINENQKLKDKLEYQYKISEIYREQKNREQLKNDDIINTLKKCTPYIEKLENRINQNTNKAKYQHKTRKVKK